MKKAGAQHKKLLEIRADPGRGGCGVLAIADLSGTPSHETICLAIKGLINMEHRGGELDGTGDGAGLLFRPERSFFERFIKVGKRLPGSKEPLMVGTVFFLRGERNIVNLQREIDVILLREGLSPLGWRKVPVNIDAVGSRAREDAPQIYQIIFAKGHRREAQLAKVLHQVKIAIEDSLSGLVNIASMSPFTTVYKALASSSQLPAFYPDLRDPSLKTNVVVGHRRYSTNTFSNWNLVQPFRHIAHNGEINSITANCRAVRDAECALSTQDTLMSHGSDSAQFDRVAEMMAANGIGCIHESIRRMMPPVWKELSLSEDENRFFEANSRALGTLGAWEGPIAIVGTDGLRLSAVVDRMGLRPMRYAMTKDGLVILSSEFGAVPVAPENIELDGQLEPGEMIIADLEEGRLISPKDSTKWIIEKTGFNFKNLSTIDLLPLKTFKPRELLPTQTLNAFGWTKEKISNLKNMISDCKEPIHGMGNDKPLAIFSENHSRLYSFLHQIVAVVTNPPIDPIREGGAVDTTVLLGRSPVVSKKSTYRSWPQYKLDHPVLTNEAMDALYNSDQPDLKTCKLDATFSDRGKPRDLVRRIHDITAEALDVIRSRRASILVLSDYRSTCEKRYPVPMLLAVSSLHRTLAENGLRRDASIVVETGEVHEGHDLAALLAYGATAVNPYAMFNIARNLAGTEPETAVKNLCAALVATLKRVMSKMGITTFTSYRGSALFEAIGISSEVVEYYIPDTVSRLGGITIEDIYQDIINRFAEAADGMAVNKNISVYRREVVDALQLVARNGNAFGDYDRFVKLIKAAPPVYLRDMLSVEGERGPVSVEAVADINDVIRSTIRGAAMSHGALNATAHRAIAAAFNHFGSMSNSGEGGEDERRNPGGVWENDRSGCRQIASGRFGVDAEYLINADEIEIKIGQGAKPGEGGHLPGFKVNAEIARIRKTQPGIDLISPPPHHDIYSIEDLAGLITNLRQFHPEAVISVKVPSITKLGTIAVGIVKAGADVITISCYSGGTGAASVGSIEHAGIPLERGISEAHQYLSANGVRRNVRIRGDGGIKCGQDIAKILALGADEVTIGTPLLVAENCVFCRGCNKGNCPVGIATQDEDKEKHLFMRRRFKDAPGHEITTEERYEEAKNGVIRFLTSVAEDLRGILAVLGLKHPRQLVGRSDLVKQKISGNPRWDKLDLSDLIMDLGESGENGSGNLQMPIKTVSAKNYEIVAAAENNRSSVSVNLKNSDHSIGSTLAGKIAGKKVMLKGGEFEILADGYAGQGFGFGATEGMRLRLEGYANDSVAEAMSGSARIVIVAPNERKCDAAPHLIGNAAAYGATGGTLYVAGKAGQRFGVRNSGAVLVCEGVGKYSFEYMTGGIGIVLGECGPCIGSGMTGGELFIYDPEKKIAEYLHQDVLAESLDAEHEERLKKILTDYLSETQSSAASSILQSWEKDKSNFLRVSPNIRPAY